MNYKATQVKKLEMCAKKVEKGTESPKDRIVLAALELSAMQGWGTVTLQDIAGEAGLSMAELHGYVEDKFDVLAALGRMIDRKTLENMNKGDPDISVRDALFDIFMDRFEVLNDHREGIIGILNSFKIDPKQAVISCPHLCRSMSWMLEAAHVNTSGITGAIKVAAMTGLYLKVLRTWMKDETADLSQTMAALDKALGRAEQFANSFGF